MNHLENPKVSIIVPVYNVENYLPKCLKCISSQTYDNYELILVDDGSTDSSGKICVEFQSNHINTKVIHQENMGLSSARNNGMQESSGEYITFVDSDDMVSEGYIEKLVYALQQANADMAVGRSLQFYNENDLFKHGKQIVVTYNTEDAFIEMCNGYKFGVSACCKLYKRELVLKYPFPIGKLYEDLDTTYKIMGECKSIVFFDDYLYFYRQRKNSISHHSVLTEAQLYGLVAADNQYNYIQINFPKASIAAQARCILKAFDYIEMISNGTKCDKQSFKVLRRYALNHSKGIILSRYVNYPNKIRFVCLVLGYYPSVLGFRILELIKKQRGKNGGRT